MFSAAIADSQLSEAQARAAYKGARLHPYARRGNLQHPILNGHIVLVLVCFPRFQWAVHQTGAEWRPGWSRVVLFEVCEDRVRHLRGLAPPDHLDHPNASPGYQP